jgi:hypothetical protein
MTASEWANAKTVSLMAGRLLSPDKGQTSVEGGYDLVADLTKEIHHGSNVRRTVTVLERDLIKI